jgi:tetratricopeptide (TPR) repeat protein
MILNYDHYHSGRKKGRRARLILTLGIVVAVLTAAVFVFRLPQKLLPSSDIRAGTAKIFDLFAGGRYDEVVSVADDILKSDPQNPYVLAYRGFASFYRAVSEVNTEEKAPHLDDAIVFLRKAKIAGTSMVGETDYILAKSYYQKGKYYYDLAISYMTRAIDDGYVQKDSYEVLGLSYRELDLPEKAMTCFLEALKVEQTDILLLTIGKTYLQMKRADDAVEYLLRTLNKTEDKTVEKDARFRLGEIYLERNELFKAEEHYLALTKLDPRSADAHVFLGDVYAKMNDRVKARSEWRTAFQINPEHYGARLRLFK